MRRDLVRAITLAVVWSVLGPVAARAHVAPSVDDNNRYLKLTPMGDRVRLAYTVLFGEVPGAAQRRSIDTDRDGAISDAEANAFGAKVAADVLASLEATVDGTTQKLAWSQIVVGMGVPKVVAGSFSVDLVAYLCLPTVRGRHEIRLHDRFRIPKPGETELKVEAGPGIQIERARVGIANDPTWAYRFVGPGGPLSDDGLDLVFVAGDAAPLGGDGGCGAEPPARGLPIWLVVGSAAILGAVLAAIVVLVQRRRR